jgi:hypothetical protein
MSDSFALPLGSPALVADVHVWVPGHCTCALCKKKVIRFHASPTAKGRMAALVCADGNHRSPGARTREGAVRKRAHLQHEPGSFSFTENNFSVKENVFFFLPGAQLCDVLTSLACEPWCLADAKILDNGVQILFCEVEQGCLDRDVRRRGTVGV